MGKVTASGGEGYDVLFVSSPFAEALNNLGLVAPIDHAKIPNLANLYPEATQLKHDPGNAFSVPYTWGTTGLCYRSDLVKTAPDKLERPAQASGRSEGQDHHARDRPLADGGGLPRQWHVGQHHGPGQARQGARPADRDEAQLLAYDDTTFYSKLVSGEASLVQAWDGWCNYGIAEKPRSSM